MKRDLEIKAIKKRGEKLSEMPGFIFDFIMFKKEVYSISTQNSYLSDIGLFFDYLLTLSYFKKYESYSDFKAEDLELEEKDIFNFLDYLTEYKKKFEGKDGNILVQTFTNSKQGKARKLATIKTLYSYLERKFKIENPAKYIEVKTNKKRKIKDRLSEEDIENFINVIANDLGLETEKELTLHKHNKDRDLAIIFLLSFTGIRISELVSLDIKDISIEQKAMIVTRKGGDEEKLYLPNAMIEVLNNFLKKRKSTLDLDSEEKEALFLSNQNKRINPRTVRDMIKKYAKRAGIEITVSPHTFRRTFASKLLEMYSDIELVAQTLGHQSIETTRAFYADISEDNKKSALSNFDYEH